MQEKYIDKDDQFLEVILRTNIKKTVMENHDRYVLNQTVLLGSSYF